MKFQTMQQYMAHPARQRTGRYLAPALALIIAAGCDTSVTNPGPVVDSFLDSLSAHGAVVTGASRNLSRALDQIAYWGGALTYEINPAGSTGSFGIPSSVQDGRLEQTFSGDWDRAQRARWTAEDAVARFRRVLPEIANAPAFASYGPAGEAALLAGYANRMIAENFCGVVFDAGTPEAFTVGLTRAEAAFIEAASIASASGDTQTATAAAAGRASVLADLASYGLAAWADAAAAAAGVANTFVHTADYSDQSQAQSNFIMIAAPGLGTYRAHTTWGTFYEDYFRTTPLDTRTPWTTDAEPFGDAGVTKFGGNVAFLPQAKYDDQDDPINLSSGWEMRLIQAEAALQTAGGAAAAVGFMNQRRADLGLTALTVTTDAQAYTDLKLERALELWLEGRRMFDIRRWQENNIAGGISDVRDGVYGTATAALGPVGLATPVGVLDTQLTTLATNARCWPIGRSEVETNSGVSR